MESKDRERRMYWRNALVCFACTIVCIVFDVRKYMVSGFTMDWNTALSFLLYILLIAMGIRAVYKARTLKDEE